MLLGEATLHYGIDGHELLAYVSSGELCALCYEHFGDCEHTMSHTSGTELKDAVSEWATPEDWDRIAAAMHDDDAVEVLEVLNEIMKREAIHVKTIADLRRWH